MIKEVENKSQFNWFNIIYTNGNVGCFTNEKENLKINFNKDGGSQTDMRTFSLSELEKISLIILNAYLFSHKKLEEMINNNFSDIELANQQKLIILIRNVLKEITEYINSYNEKIIEKYRNI